MVEPTTGKDVVNMETIEVTEQEAPGQVAPEQSLVGTLSEGHLTMKQGHVPETSQDVPEQDVATPSSTQSGLPNPATRGKVAVRPSITGPSQEQEQASADQTAESDDDIIDEIQGHPQDGRQHVYVCRGCGDHYVCHEEISIDKETERVE
jgi:hypothetical protein